MRRHSMRSYRRGPRQRPFRRFFLTVLLLGAAAVVIYIAVAPIKPHQSERATPVSADLLFPDT